jgi:hypothetical protein
MGSNELVDLGAGGLNKGGGGGTQQRGEDTKTNHMYVKRGGVFKVRRTAERCVGLRKES